ncbi:MAG: agmatine deiminase family protein [Cypionkella sp.]|nr:agmatine deiminase family protein [Cypionkella sp.]
MGGYAKANAVMTRRGMIGAATLAAVGVTAGAARAGVKGWHYPDEARPHARTFMQWPVSRAVYRDTVFLGMVQQTIADIANTIAEFEPVVMLVAGTHQAKARRKLSSAVEMWDIPTDDLWARDSGPSFVVDGGGNLGLAQFNFNGWGGKQAHPNDGQIAARVAQRLGLPIVDTGIIGEAGGVETDGAGTLIAHESSWINQNRNKEGKVQIEARLLALMGARKMIWAPGIAGADITDFHIDALARFAGKGRVVIQMGDLVDPSDPWSVAGVQTRDILAAATDADGRKLDLVVIPDPIRTRVDSADFVASYVNYYVCNGAVICAQFGDKKADARAAEVLGALYPGREVVALNVDPLGEIGGGIHCATHEQPQV